MIFDIIAKSSGFTPKDLSGLVMWLDGADRFSMFTGTYADRLISTTNPTSDGDLLCRWEDKSGSSNNALCNSDDRRASYASIATLNGKTGNTTGGSTAGGWYHPRLIAGPKTWFIVHKYNGATPLYGALCGHADTYMDLAISSNVSWRLSLVRAQRAWHDSGFTQGTSPRLYRVVFNGNNSTFWTTVDSVETQRQTLGTIGTAPKGDSLTLPGQYYEVAVFNRILTASEIGMMNAYIKTKWNI